MSEFLGNIKNFFLDALFSPVCVVCRKDIISSNNLVCSSCISKIKINNSFFCPICKAELPSKTCHIESPFLLGAASNYADPIVQKIIHSLKYRKIKGLANIVSEVLFDYLENSKLDFKKFVVVPIPLHRQKKLSRGFNQSEEMAKVISKKFGVPLLPAIKRIKNNKPQANIREMEKRIENAKNCFALEEKIDIKGKNVILLDDVFTSGATVNEAVKILRSGGAKQIIVLVAAKA